MKMVERRQIHFRGQVQGVGFRYTAVSVARRYAITGYVQNLSDGRVVLVAEGDLSELDRYVADLSAEMTGYIRETQTERQRATGEFTSFGVRY